MKTFYSRCIAVGTAWVVAAAAVCYFGDLKTASAAGQTGRAAFNSGQVRPPEDPAKVIHGKALYGINCQACHGADLRGGDMGDAGQMSKCKRRKASLPVRSLIS